MFRSYEQLANERLEGKTFDWAIPQPIYDEIQDVLHLNPCGDIVWLYDEQAKVFGRPFGLTLRGYQIIKIMSFEWWEDQ